MIYAFDSNTVSYLLRDEGNTRQTFKNRIIETDGNLYVIPFIVFYEIKRWLLDKPTKLTKSYFLEFDKLFQSVRSMAEVPEDVWLKAADIYILLKQRGQLIGDADILIAAYCLVNDYILVTRNRSDFIRIDGLKFVNWFE